MTINTPVKKIDTRDTLRIVTKDNFIDSFSLPLMSVKAKKLAYLTIAQCRMNDEGFDTYEITSKQFAALLGIESDKHLKYELDAVSDELLRFIICIGDEDGSFNKFQMFSHARYDAKSGIIQLKLHEQMNPLLLNIKDSFNKPLVWDFLKMNSAMTMGLWHLFQKKMKSQKPGFTDTISFECTMEELRTVTGTKKKFNQLGQFKEKVLDKAIREIRDNCNVSITYVPAQKVGKTIKSFTFIARNVIVIDEQKLDPLLISRTELKVKSQKLKEKKDGLSNSEKEELKQLEEKIKGLEYMIKMKKEVD